ncbi:MAG: hypothetical protein AUJ75_02050 [Candidatus Omnitrophica bacterium CG1_02_49_10]|nr:MAG: hypothetical protein AUJ75_02050 [Candidatus Omnitrophica bacterium CG1_02_49_10]
MRRLAAWTLNLLLPYGGVGLFTLAFCESSFFPIPPDVLLIALAIADNKASFLLASIATAGSVLGGAFGYLLGRSGARPILKRLISEDKMLTVEHYYKKYDIWAVGIAGFTPIPYKIFTVSAGIFGINFTRFFIVSFFSRGARFFLVATVIYFFGPAIRMMLTRYLNLFTLFLVLLLVGGFILLNWLNKRRIRC